MSRTIFTQCLLIALACFTIIGSGLAQETPVPDAKPAKRSTTPPVTRSSEEPVPMPPGNAVAPPVSTEGEIRSVELKLSFIQLKGEILITGFLRAENRLEDIFEEVPVRIPDPSSGSNQTGFRPATAKRLVGRRAVTRYFPELASIPLDKAVIYLGSGKRLTPAEYQTLYGENRVPAMLVADMAMLRQEFGFQVSPDALIVEYRDAVFDHEQAVAATSSTTAALSDANGAESSKTGKAFFEADEIPDRQLEITLARLPLQTQTQMRKIQLQVPYAVQVEQAYTVMVPYTENRTQNYTVPVLVTEQVPQSYTVTVPYTESVTADDGSVNNVTKYRVETRTRMVNVSRTAMETRTREVPVTRMRPEQQTRTIIVTRIETQEREVRYASFFYNYNVRVPVMKEETLPLSRTISVSLFRPETRTSSVTQVELASGREIEVVQLSQIWPDDAVAVMGHSNPADSELFQENFARFFHPNTLILPGGYVPPPSRKSRKTTKPSSNEALQTNNRIWDVVKVAPVGDQPVLSKYDLLAIRNVVKHFPSGIYFNTLGAAEYRCGNYQAAIEACSKSLELSPDEENYPGPHPIDLAVIAMSHFRLGQSEQAQEFEKKFEQAMKPKKFSNDEECLSFARELAELMKSSDVTHRFHKTEQYSPFRPDNLTS